MAIAAALSRNIHTFVTLQRVAGLNFPTSPRSLLHSPATQFQCRAAFVAVRTCTLNADYYYINFQNVYTSSPDPNNPSAAAYSQAGNTAAKGFEAEANVYLYKGLSLYGNGTWVRRGTSRRPSMEWQIRTTTNGWRTPRATRKGWA